MSTTDGLKELGPGPMLIKVLHLSLQTFTCSRALAIKEENLDYTSENL